MSRNELQYRVISESGAAFRGNQRARQAGDKMKILAVDDDEILLELLAATLQMLGYAEVTTAGSASDALQIIGAEKQPFDCLLFDIQMPEMDGIQLCSIVKSMEPYKQVPVIMITAMTDRSFVDRAFAAGAVDYVTKPFDELELGTRLRIAERKLSGLALKHI